MSDNKVMNMKIVEWRRPSIPLKRQRWLSKYPRPPKRPTSGYFQYLQDNLRYYNRITRRKVRNRKEVINIALNDWRSDKASRTWYNNRAKKDMEQYVRDVQSWQQTYFGHMKHKPKLRRRDYRRPDAPKRPLTSFFLFRAEVEKRVKAQNPSWMRQQILKHIGAMWNQMTAEQKNPYKRRQAELSQEYRATLMEYRQKRHFTLERQSFMNKQAKLRFLRANYPRRSQKSTAFLKEQLTVTDRASEYDADLLRLRHGALAANQGNLVFLID